MKRLLVLTVVLGVAACTTPKRITDTASLIGDMSNDMDRTVASYVAALNRVRELDQARLQTSQRRSELRVRKLHDQMQVLALADGGSTQKLLQQLTELSAPIESTPAVAAISLKSSPLKFDNSALQTVAKISTDIAKPRGTSEQLAVVLKFAEAVNQDLQKAADDEATKTQPAQ